MLAFGGADADGVTSFNDVRVLSNADGANGLPAWAKLRVIGDPPVARMFHTAVFDLPTRRMVVYGGGSTEGNFLSVWQLRTVEQRGWRESCDPGLKRFNEVPTYGTTHFNAARHR